MHDKYKSGVPFDRFGNLRPPSEDPFLKQLNDEVEANAYRNEYTKARATWIHRITEGMTEMYEQQIFQNLLPEFDRIPMKRAFMACVYSPKKEDGILDPPLESLYASVINASETEPVWQYPVLTGSRLYRCTLRTSQRQTRKEFDNTFGYFGEQLTQCLQEDGDGKITVVNNFRIGTVDVEKAHGKDWTEQIKNLTEAVKNLVLIGAGLCFMFDGTFVKTADSQSKKPEVSVFKLPRDKELELLPKILDAEKPQDFREVVGPLTHESSTEERGEGGRKFR
jgi:hypothetical protein